MINAYWEGMEFEVPSVPEPSDSVWMRWIDTALESPDDVCTWDDAETVREIVYPVQPRSVVILVARMENEGKQ